MTAIVNRISLEICFRLKAVTTTAIKDTTSNAKKALCRSFSDIRTASGDTLGQRKSFSISSRGMLASTIGTYVKIANPKRIFFTALFFPGPSRV